MIQFLRGTKSQLNSNSTVIAAGQPVFELDTGQLKIGTGNSRYSALEYVGSIFENTGGGGGDVTFGGSLPTSSGYIDFPGGLRISYGLDSFSFNSGTSLTSNFYWSGRSSWHNLTRNWVSNLKTYVLFADMKPIVDEDDRGCIVSGWTAFNTTGNIICTYKAFWTGNATIKGDLFYWVWSRD